MVAEEPSHVLDRLARSEGLHKFSKVTGGADIYVSADHVAYIEQVPEQTGSISVPPPSPSRNRIS
jgi:hypothetical protein